VSDAAATPQGPVEARGTGSRFGAPRALAGLRELTLVPALALAVFIGTFTSDAFLTGRNIENILQQSSELAVVVIAEALILISGKFDLSLESVVGLAPMIGAYLVLPEAAGGSGLGLNPVLGVLLVLLIGAVVGFGNGFLVVKLKLNAFIVTLAMLILLRGLTLGVTNATTLSGLPAEFTFVGDADLLGLPLAIWIAGLLFLLAGAFLRYHAVGRAVYAVGGNAEAARAAGIRVERVTWAVFIVGGVLAALAGLMLTGRIASVTASQGQNLIFTVFAAAVIGGISLNGGRGRMLGALTGVLLLGVISNILTLSQVEAFWIDATFGAIILLALIVARFTSGETSEED